MADWTENPPSNNTWRTAVPEENQWQPAVEQQSQRPWTTHEHGTAAVSEREMAAIISAEAAAAAAKVSEQRAEADRAEIAVTFSTFTGQYNAFVTANNAFVANLASFNTRLDAVEDTTAQIAAEWAAFDAPADGKVYGRLNDAWTLISVAGSTAASLVPFTSGAVLTSTNVQTAIEEAAPPQKWDYLFASLQSQKNITGGGVLSNTSGDIKWTNRFMVNMGGNKGVDNRFYNPATTNNSGNFVNIYMPAVGALIDFTGGATLAVTANGIPLGSWRALYYDIANGNALSDNNGTGFHIVQYNSGPTIPIPATWILLAVHNSDAGHVTFFTNGGVYLSVGDTYNTATSIVAKLAGKANSVHTHLWADITDAPDPYVHPTTDGNRHVPATGSGDVTPTSAPYASKYLRTAATVGGVPVWDTVDWVNVTGKPTTFAPSAHTHLNATTAADGFMSAADKSKLNGIDDGANNYVHPTTDGNRHVPATLAGDVSVVGAQKYLRASTAAGVAPAWDTVAWGDIQGKPTTFAPSAHSHTRAEISDATTIGRTIMGAADAAAVLSAIGYASNKKVYRVWAVNDSADYVLTANGAASAEQTITPTTPTSELVFFWLPSLSVLDNVGNTNTNYSTTTLTQYLTSAGAWSQINLGQAESYTGIVGFGGFENAITYGAPLRMALLGSGGRNASGNWQIRGYATVSTTKTTQIHNNNFIFMEVEP